MLSLVRPWLRRRPLLRARNLNMRPNLCQSRQRCFAAGFRLPAWQ